MLLKGRDDRNMTQCAFTISIISAKAHIRLTSLARPSKKRLLQPCWARTKRGERGDEQLGYLSLSAGWSDEHASAWMSAQHAEAEEHEGA